MADYRIEQDIYEQSFKQNCFDPIHLHLYFLNISQELLECDNNHALKRSRDFETF